MALELRPFDAADYLDDPESMGAFLEDAFQSGDMGVISDAVGALARAKGMSQLAREVGMSRQSLYRALSHDGHPQFATMLKVLNAVGLTLSARPLAAPDTSAEPGSEQQPA